jgi:hypothetical protein
MCHIKIQLTFEGVFTMNPFDYRVSNIVCEERIRQSDYQRNWRGRETRESDSIQRNVVVFGQFWARLRQLLGVNLPSKTAKSASHLS